MRLSGLNCRGVPSVLVGAVGLAVALSLFVQCRLTREDQQTPRSLEASSGDGTEPKVEVCQKKSTDLGGRESGGKTKGELELSAAKGVPLKFRCGDGLALRPANEKEVYKYNPADSKTCVTDNAGPLATELVGAELTKEGTAQNSSRQSAGPVYVFKYSTEPEDDKHLCYTCVTAASDQSSTEEQPEAVTRSKASQGTVECTVYITVPKKKEEQTSSSSTTKSPDSPSAACAVPAGIATATGIFLAVMLWT